MREKFRVREKYRVRDREIEREREGGRKRDRESDNSSLTFCFENPGSTTKTIPSIVREVSAILVLTTTFLPTKKRKKYHPIK